ncbi:MAG: hypothetical protein AAF628_03250 [Planctomycetota bacterium]
MNQIPDGVWTRPIAGRNLGAASLGEEVGESPTLLVFLRHLG